jgi:transposase-like protein
MAKKCERCGATEKLQMHHISYDPEITQDLCVNCHRNIHGHGVGSVGFQGTAANLLENSREEVIMLCEAGATNSEIANAVGVNPQTVRRGRGILGFKGQGEDIKKGDRKKMEEEGINVNYIEDRVIRADNTIMLGLKMVRNSSLSSEENVKVETEIGSGRIVISRTAKGENDK